MKIEIYSDVVCPWCYVGKRRFERALDEFPDRESVEVVYRPYQLDPSAPEAAIPLNDYLERRFGGRANGMQGTVTAAAREEGVEIDWDGALAANTRMAHRVMGLAEREYGADVQKAVAERLFAMHFSEGGDIGSVDQLVEAAVTAGVEEERVRSYLANGEGEEELEADLARGSGMGIRAVPTFVIDGLWVVQGAQRAEVFREALETVAERAAGAGEACGDDGCAV